MTIGMRDYTTEEQAMGLLYKEVFRTQASVERGGATLAGTGTTFSDGVVLNGSGNLLYSESGAEILRPSMTFKFTATLGFATDEAVNRYFYDIRDAAGNSRFYVFRTNTGVLQILSFGTIILSVAHGTWAPFIFPGEENYFSISTTSGSNTLWINMAQVATSATAWTFGTPRATSFSIGAQISGADRFIGTFHDMEIYGNTSVQGDIQPLTEGATTYSILPDKSLITLPGTSCYARASDGLFVTDALGKSGVTQALMGSDGSTVAQFPAIIPPRGLRGDGGDRVNCGDNDLFSFTTGAADRPFSLACIVQQTAATNATLIAKSTSTWAGEYLLYMAVSGNTCSPMPLLIDDVGGGYIGRVAAAFPWRVGVPLVVVFTYSGSGTTAGIRFYVNGARGDDSNVTNPPYTCMRNTATPLTIAGGNAVASDLTGNIILPTVFDFELSPLQARAWSAWARRVARVG